MDYTTAEVLDILAKYGFTQSQQMVRRWIRNGTLKGRLVERDNRKSGYVVAESDLLLFLKDNAPGLVSLIEENKALKTENSMLKLQQEKENNESEQSYTVFTDDSNDHDNNENVEIGGVKTFFVSRSEVRSTRLFYASQKRQKDALNNYLFKGKKNGEKLKLLVPFNQTLIEYLDNIAFKVCFQKDDLDNKRKARGEMRRYYVMRLHEDLIIENKIIQSLSLTPDEHEEVLRSEIFPVVFAPDESDNYTNLYNGEAFYNPLNKKNYDNVKDAVTSIILKIYKELEENDFKVFSFSKDDVMSLKGLHHNEKQLAAEYIFRDSQTEDLKTVKIRKTQTLFNYVSKIITSPELKEYLSTH
ncbi:hypothetical protein ABEY96_28210 [Priestia aryabhattai]|uniref:hypothetical protein n=1 Tax=Priestia aryabhattai TaxID=412384 RepID=UPI003D2DD4AF